MIRVAIVDDHPALRAGLEAVLRGEPGIVPVGAVERLADVAPLLYRTRPDVLLLDYHLPGEDGLLACRRIKQDLLAPKVLLYTAYAGGELAVPAALAGADGLLSKAVPARELYDALRRVARGERVGPPLTAEARRRAADRVPAGRRALLEGLLDGVATPELCDRLELSPTALGDGVEELIAALRVEVRSATT